MTVLYRRAQWVLANTKSLQQSFFFKCTYIYLPEVDMLSVHTSSCLYSTTTLAHMVFNRWFREIAGRVGRGRGPSVFTNQDSKAVKHDGNGEHDADEQTGGIKILLLGEQPAPTTAQGHRW